MQPPPSSSGSSLTLPTAGETSTGGAGGSSSSTGSNGGKTASGSGGRSESPAYPKHHSNFVSKIQWYIRQNSKAVLATLAFGVFILIVSSDLVHDNLGPTAGGLRKSSSGIGVIGTVGGENFAGAIRRGYFTIDGSKKKENVYRFAAVTDLDQLSWMKEMRKPTYRSILLPGTITYHPETHKYTIQMDEKPRELTTKHNEAGRGAEFSELTIFNNRLLTFDDRTGDVFEILNKPDGSDSFVVPRFVLTEGEGDTDKGMKWEWSTVKDGELYMGSMGKEFTNSDGTIANKNNLWVSIMNRYGQVRRVDWTEPFTVVRRALKAQYPGYLIHEAINWSPTLKLWVFAPRRISSESYNDVLDEKRGSNKIVLVDENFKNPEVVTVKMPIREGGLHGFSSFAFIPHTDDRHVLALRSVEEDCAADDLDVCKQRSYFCIFDVTNGDLLMDEVKIEQDMKFEGVEFVNMYTIPPRT